MTAREGPIGQCRRWLWCVGGQIVEGEGYVLAVEIDLEHAVHRLADDGELVERSFEETLLQDAADNRDQNDEAGMQRLGRMRRWKSLALLVTRTKSPSRA